MLGPRIMKVDREVDHCQQMTPIDFEVSRLKVKVTVYWNRLAVSGYSSKMLGPRIMKVDRKVGHDQQVSPIHFEVSRSKVTVTRNSYTVDSKQ